VAIVVNTFCKGFIPKDIPNGGPTPGGFGTGMGLLLVALSLCGFVWIVDYFWGGNVGMQQPGEIAER
jgi:hypothetical protein